MTPDNEPSVADRYDLNGACEGESGYCREGLARDDNGDWVLYSAHAAIVTRLERRCAELEKALRGARAWVVSGKCDDYFEWIRRRDEALEAISAALYDSVSLPPERANYGTPKEDGQ